MSTNREIKLLAKLVGDLKNGSPVRRKNRKKRNKQAQMSNSTSVTAPMAGSVIVRRGKNVPKIQTLGVCTTVSHTELITTVDLAAAGAFSNVRAALIPGNFTWLSGVANAFSKFRWIYLRLIYIPVCPTTTTGQAVFGLGYDFTDNTPGSLAVAQQKYQSVTTPVWGGFEGTNLMNHFRAQPTAGAVVVDVDCERLGGPIGDSYYRFKPVGNFLGLTTVDQNIFGPAFCDISTSGGPVAATLAGNLFAEYVVELIEPIADSTNA